MNVNSIQTEEMDTVSMSSSLPSVPFDFCQQKENISSESLQIAYSKDLEDQAQELRALGISVVDQISLEENVAAAVDEAVVKHNRKQKLRILKKEIKGSQLEIIKIQKKEKDLQHRLEGMRQRLTDPHQYLAVEQSLKENRDQLNVLINRKKYVEEKLLESNDNESVLDEVDLNLEEGELVELEDETFIENKLKTQFDCEKMIQEGKMTPFGTILNNFESGEKFVPCSSASTREATPDSSEVKSVKESVAARVSQMSPLVKPSTDSEILDKSARVTTGMSEFERYLQDQIHKQRSHSLGVSSTSSKRKVGDRFYGNFKSWKRKPKEFTGTVAAMSADNTADTSNEKERTKSPLKRRILQPRRHWKERNLGSLTSESEADQNKVPGRMLSERLPFLEDEDHHAHSDSDYVPSVEEEEGEEEAAADDEKMAAGTVQRKSDGGNKVKRRATTPRKNSSRLTLEEKKSLKRSIRKVKDDGHVEDFVERIKRWTEERLKEKQRKIIEREDDPKSEDEEDLYEVLDGGFKVPLSIWNKLYKYQKTCVKWLWELHTQKCGGILGDEMGLGKTVMVISFLVGLSYSGLADRGRRGKGLGPVLIVSPATVLHQWVQECHKWWPPFRVAVLHDSGTFVGKKSALIHNINKHEGILVTSYQGVIDQLKVFLNYDWHYIILDEGHKIRNPEAQITVAVKRFQTSHRIILSGSPIQNSLKELWSLFDFIYPGKLGTLSVFLQQFAVPITQGGYANATMLEVQTAFRCATVLRDTINPYLLRRMKKDVRSHLTLPDKNEQVLFCGLTEEQRTLYRDYLDGNQVKSILNRRLQVFVGLINLRKICNHPNLYDGGPRYFKGEDISALQPEQQYGWWKRAGKMIVLHSILKLWKRQDHRVLLFTQSRQMMCVLEKYVQDEEYTYLKMDGTTSVSSRQPLIQRFNGDPSIFVFLLTTRVGGIGVNLTGADRVVLYDPDWNPSTDTQARERAWRIGQKRHVTIYRLLTAGTIEEKIYHRQIFKQFLTNRVLKDPKQQRFFKTNDLYELFTLNEGDREKTESSAIFAGTGSEITVAPKYGHKSKDKTPNGIAISKGRNGVTACKSSLLTGRNPVASLERKHNSGGGTGGQASSLNLKTDESATRMEDRARIQQVKVAVGETKESVANKADECSHCNAIETVPEEGRDFLNRDVPFKLTSTDSRKCEKEEESSVLLQSESLPKSESYDDAKETTGGPNNHRQHQHCHNNECSPVKSCDDGKTNEDAEYEASDEKKRRMRELARFLSKKIAEGKSEERKEEKASSGERERKKKKAKNKKREKGGKKLEGERINNLVKRRKYKYTATDDADEEWEEQQERGKSQDDFVLRKLFKKSGVHTALSHDTILNSGDPDYLLLESEANRVATEALRQVRLSRAKWLQPQAASHSDDTVARKKQNTFGNKKSLFLEDRTKAKKRSGRRSPVMFNGGIEDDESLSEEAATVPLTSPLRSSPSAPEECAFSDVLSSAQLLKRMRERRHGLEGVTDQHQPHETGGSSQRDARVMDPYGPITYDPNYPSTSDPDNPEVPVDDPELEGHVELLTDIRNFVAFQAATDGQASTQEVIQRFAVRLPPSCNHIFKALLNNICDFVRDSSGQGYWHLKSEFR